MPLRRHCVYSTASLTLASQGQQAYAWQGHRAPMAPMHTMPLMQVPQGSSAKTGRAKPTRQKARKQKRQVAEDLSQQAPPTTYKGTRGKKRKRGSAAEPELNLEGPELPGFTANITPPPKMAKLSHVASLQAPQTWTQTIGDDSAPWAQSEPQSNQTQCYMNQYTTATGLPGPLMQDNQYASFPTLEVASIPGQSQPEFRPVGLLDNDWLMMQEFLVPDQVPQPLEGTEIGSAGIEKSAAEAHGALPAPLETAAGDKRADSPGDAGAASLPNEEIRPEPSPDDLYKDLEGNEVGVGVFPDFYDFEPGGGVHAEDQSMILTAEERDLIDFFLARPMTEEEAREAEEIVNAAAINNMISGTIEASPATPPPEVQISELLEVTQNDGTG
ncbi:hypothetical protein NQ176_g4451 [Zarea fungicola]|uniref:Uncharacterized protein n=1 Tax=Zarea fungicola TaxID=93591 RepID=A0ACC1NG06_9HYPO|nr:hypothetical protein NQ176_g4451 [Lecanicillium fungicola]